jgi:hypothetical protein
MGTSTQNRGDKMIVEELCIFTPKQVIEYITEEGIECGVDWAPNQMTAIPYVLKNGHFTGYGGMPFIYKMACPIDKEKATT